MISCKLSSHNSARVCHKISEKGDCLPTPKQSSIYKATYRQATKLKGTMKANFKEDIYAIHFDGKWIRNREYQDVILRSETKEIELDILCLNDGKAETISQALEEVISEYHLWNCIKMIVCDTTNVNIGRVNGVVLRFQRLLILKADV